MFPSMGLETSLNLRTPPPRVSNTPKQQDSAFKLEMLARQATLYAQGVKPANPAERRN